MTYRTRILQGTLTVWCLMLLADAALIFTDREAALARWHGIQATAAAESGSAGGQPLAFEATGLAALGIDLYAAAVLTLAIVALVTALLWRAAHRPEARVLAVFLSFLMAPGMLLERVGIPTPVYLAATSALGFVTVAAFLRFAALFPRPLAAAELDARRRWVRALQVASLRPRVVWGAAAFFAVATALAVSAWGPVAGLLGVVVVVPILVGVALLRRGYRVAGAEERRKLLWVVQGFYTAAWVLAFGVAALLVLSVRAGIVSALAGTPAASATAFLVFNLAVELGMLIILVSLATAIFYHGALEPGLVIQKTTVYGILTVAGAATFGLVENLASDVFLAAAGLPQSWGGPIAGAVVAGAVTVLRPRISGWVGRRFPGMAPAAAG